MLHIKTEPKNNKEQNPYSFFSSNNTMTETNQWYRPLLDQVLSTIEMRTNRYANHTSISTIESTPITPESITLKYYHHIKNSVDLTLDAEFFCQTTEQDLKFKHTWIFDADDTLWEDNYYYEELKKLLVKYLISHDDQLTEKEILDLIDKTETEVIAEHGFGPIGFSKSLKITCEKLHASSNKILVPEQQFFDAVITILTNLPLSVPDETIRALTALREAGHGLVLYTRGHSNVQFPKIARSELGHYFHAVAITKKKTSVELQRLIEQQITFKTEIFTYVGNSLASDIKPAVELGMRAFYFDNPNTWHFEHYHEIPEEKYTKIRQLTELLPHAIPSAKLQPYLK
jgi:putative hydrolase of the HAD superfamily